MPNKFLSKLLKKFSSAQMLLFHTASYLIKMSNLKIHHKLSQLTQKACLWQSTYVSQFEI